MLSPGDEAWLAGQQGLVGDLPDLVAENRWAIPVAVFYETVHVARGVLRGLFGWFPKVSEPAQILIIMVTLFVLAAWTGAEWLN